MKSDKRQILNRLATIEGHLKGIRKMVEDDQYCVDIVKQSFAVERALKAFESALLEGHLAACVPNGFKEGRDDEMIQQIERCASSFAVSSHASALREEMYTLAPCAR